ncbi:M23 family metallopeptidase [Brackiella oedipodis]|uniref:M23 family metallopeptidase n=1 Tax=Brackiella oedipodis TaxID=124225 RepID=UPI000688FCD0|nr:M23 family metallopeptidase [Brackiella oedipodis]
MLPKNKVPDAQHRTKTHKIWRFNLVILSLGLAVLGGMLLERYWGASSTVKLQEHADTHSVLQNQNEQELISQHLTELSRRTAELNVQAQKLERLSTLMADKLPMIHEELSKAQLLPSEITDNEQKPDEEGFENANDETKDADSAEKIGHDLDVLKNKLSLQQDRFNILEVIINNSDVNMQRLPTAYPVSMLQARVSSPFGYRYHPILGTYKLHTGVDLALSYGSPVQASSGGLVVFAGTKTGYGRVIDIDHGNQIVTRYAHLSKITVKEGDIVSKQQLIGNVGTSGYATGPHLHYEIRINDVPVNPFLVMGKDYRQYVASHLPMLERIKALTNSNKNQIN